MNVGKTFYAKNRREWRAWLSKAPPHRPRDLADLLQEAERQAAHPLQPRRGGGAVLRLDRQPPEADRCRLLRSALLAAPSHEPSLRHEPRAGAPADRFGPHDQVRPGKHQARLRSQERHEAQTEVGGPQRDSAASQAGSRGLAELPALSRVVPADPHRLDRGREASAGRIRAAARLLPQDDRAEQAGPGGAVGAGASTTWSRPPPPAPRPAAG